MISRRNLMWLLLAGGLSWPQCYAYAEDNRRDGREDTGGDGVSDNREDNDGEDNDAEDNDAEDNDGEDKDGEDKTVKTKTAKSMATTTLKKMAERTTIRIGPSTQSGMTMPHR